MEQVFQKIGTMKSNFDIHFDAEHMFFAYEGHVLRIRLEDASKRLQHASEQDRYDFKISPSGYGIHWPKIDEDLSFAGLAKVAEKVK